MPEAVGCARATRGEARRERCGAVQVARRAAAHPGRSPGVGEVAVGAQRRAHLHERESLLVREGAQLSPPEAPALLEELAQPRQRERDLVEAPAPAPRHSAPPRPSSSATRSRVATATSVESEMLSIPARTRNSAISG